MALILNIDTSTNLCSVCLANNSSLIDIKEKNAYAQHSVLLAEYIKEIFNDSAYIINSLDAVAISRGPGSFTGLRIGTAIAKGICYGLEIPLISICTLRAMCNGLLRSEIFKKWIKKKKIDLNHSLLCPMIDARRKDVYTALFTSKIEKQTDISHKYICKKIFSNYLKKKKIIFFGNGAFKIKDIIEHPNVLLFEDYQLSSSHLIHLSERAYRRRDFVDIAYFEPFYLKDFVPTKPKKIFGIT